MSFVWTLTAYAVLSCMTWGGLAADPPLGTYRKKCSSCTHVHVRICICIFAVYCKRHHSAVYTHMPKVLSVYVLIKWYIFQRNTPKSILRRFWFTCCLTNTELFLFICHFTHCIWDKIVIYVIKSKIFQLASSRAFKKHLMQLFLKSQIEQLNKCRYILMQNSK